MWRRLCAALLSPAPRRMLTQTVFQRALGSGATLAGKSFLIPTLKLRPRQDVAVLASDLTALVQRAPGVYRGAAVVLDGTDAGIGTAQELAEIARGVRSSGLAIAGVTGVAASLVSQAQLPVLMTGGRSSSSGGSGGGGATAKNAASSSTAGQRSTLIVAGNVRGGQQVYGSGCSVTVLGSVHPGGEVIADGDVHVLGKLDGRAMAGVTGARESVIVAGAFRAQLVSIGDVFTVCEELPPGLVPDRPAVVRLVGDALQFAHQ